MRCDQCKNWTLEEPESGYYPGREDGFGLCLRIEHPEVIRDALELSPNWEKMSWDMQQKALMGMLKVNKAYVADASDYRAFLWTLPNFGCVGFEPK